MSFVWGIENTACSHLVRISHILLCLLSLLPRFCANPRPEPSELLLCVFWVLRQWVLENLLLDLQCCLRAPLPKERLCNTALCSPPLGLLLTALMHLSDRKQQHSPKLELFSDSHSHVPVVLQLVSKAGTGVGLFCSGQCFEIPELSSEENFTQFM